MLVRARTQSSRASRVATLLLAVTRAGETAALEARSHTGARTSTHTRALSRLRRGSSPPSLARIARAHLAAALARAAHDGARAAALGAASGRQQRPELAPHCGGPCRGDRRQRGCRAKRSQRGGHGASPVCLRQSSGKARKKQAMKTCGKHGARIQGRQARCRRYFRAFGGSTVRGIAWVWWGRSDTLRVWTPYDSVCQGHHPCRAHRAAKRAMVTASNKSYQVCLPTTAGQSPLPR